MISLEYLNENGLKKYPFIDDATLIPTNGITIPSNLFLDAGMYPNTYQRILLTSIEKTVETIRIYLDGFDVIEFTIADVTQLLRSTFSVTGLSGFFTFGAGLTTLPNNTYLFTDNSNFILDSRVLPIVPLVTSVTTQNYNLGDTTTNIGNTDTEFVLSEGNNLQLAQQLSGATASVLARAGTGLFNPCIDSPYIRTINGVSTQNGSFLFSTDACQRLTSPEEHTIFIENLCTAGCSAEAIESSAYYINRVNDGVAQLGDAIKDFRDDLNAQIEEYLAVTVPERETPYTTSTIAKFGSGTPSSGTKINYTYFTMRTYVYNPSTTPVVVTAAGTIGASAGLISILYLDKNGDPVTTTAPSLPPAFCTTSTTPCRSFSVGCKEFVVVKLTMRVKNPAFGSTISTITIDTDIGSKTYNVKTGL